MAGKPLIAWTIEEAKKSRHIGRMVVSSEDAEILAIAEGLGCETLKQPAELAGDNSSHMDVILHVLEKLPGHDMVVLLQPTSPLRKTEDIDACIERCETATVSFCNGKPNGAVYAAKADWFLEHKTFGHMSPYTCDVYEMPPERSLDIDEEADLVEADRLLRRRRANEVPIL